MNSTPWAMNGKENRVDLSIGVIYAYKALALQEPKPGRYRLQSPQRYAPWPVDNAFRATCEHVERWRERLKEEKYRRTLMDVKYAEHDLYGGADKEAMLDALKARWYDKDHVTELRTRWENTGYLHDPPDLRCACGVYAGKTMSAVKNWSADDTIGCVVELSGHIIEGDIGYRAEKALIRGVVSGSTIPDERMVEVAVAYRAKLILPWMVRFDSIEDVLAY